MVLLPEGADDVYVLRGTAAIAWGELEVPRTPEQLSECLAVHTGHDPNDVQHEVAETLRALAELGAIEQDE